MAKNLEILNQLAVVVDNIEKINIKSENIKIVYNLSKSEFDEMFSLIQMKFGRRIEKPEQTFNISIGTVDIVFNMNNV